MSHPKFAQTAVPVIDAISQRWSPYAFAAKPVAEADLQALFEAARWAASAYNEQPWRYLLATKADQAEYDRMLSCLVEPNQAWAKAAPVLVIGCCQLKFTLNGQTNGTALHDLGLASGNLSAEATARGLAVHQMGGILPERVKELYGLPDDVQALTAIAIGYAAELDTLPADVREREQAPRSRKPLSELVFSGSWNRASKIVSK